MSDKLSIHIQFTKKDTEGHEYTDALIYTPEEYAKLTPDEIESQKQARFDNWVNYIKNPPQAPEIPEEEKLAQVEQMIQDLESQKASLVSEKEALTQAIAVEEIAEAVVKVK